MEIKKVALIGAGAIGSYLIWGLSRLADLSFTVIADGQRGERLREKGLVINGEPFRPMVQGAEETGPVDLIFVTVKYGALSAILPAVTALTDSRTMIISLMNGVDSEAVLEAAVGKGHIVPALLRIASHRERGKEGIDQVTFKEPQGIRGLYYGKPAPLSQRDEVQLEALKAFFARTPLLTHMSRTIESDIWAKFLFNIGQNIPQAIVGCGTGAYADSEHVRFLKERLEEGLSSWQKPRESVFIRPSWNRGKMARVRAIPRARALPCAILRCRTWITTAIQKLICCAAVWWKWEKPLASPRPIMLLPTM